MKYTMACGCSFDINEEVMRKHGRTPEFYEKGGFIPPIVIDYYNFPDCPLVWDMLGAGYTKGVFQLESNLGRTYSKKLKPTCLEHLSALGSILRPGCMEARDENGISLTDHYCLRKNGLEEIDYPDKSLIPVLKETYGVMCYQEQALEIAKIIAGFSMGEADTLRRGIGKKLPEVIAQCKTMFIEGAKKTKVVTDEVAASIFNAIEASQRYSFNKSHSYSYALNGYRSSYAKIHMPLWFFCSYLRHSGDKQKPYEEIAELINEAKLFGIELFSPNIAHLKRHFHLASNKGIRFGIVDIKNIGDSHYNKLTEVNQIALKTYGKPLAELEWYQFLILSENLSKTAIENLMFVGAMDCYD